MAIDVLIHHLTASTLRAMFVLTRHPPLFPHPQLITLNPTTNNQPLIHISPFILTRQLHPRKLKHPSTAPFPLLPLLIIPLYFTHINVTPSHLHNIQLPLPKPHLNPIFLQLSRLLIQISPHLQVSRLQMLLPRTVLNNHQSLHLQILLSILLFHAPDPLIFVLTRNKPSLTNPLHFTLLLITLKRNHQPLPLPTHTHSGAQLCLMNTLP